jgi:D-alanine-D-alanine ligase
MNRIRVGVLRGGPSNEYEISLKTGGNVLSALREDHEEKYRPVDIFIDKDGYFYLDGVSVEPNDIISRVDVIFNALHGEYGEDGKIQSFFETHRVPFTGSGSLASAIGMNKILSKKAFEAIGIKTPRHKEISKDRIINDMQRIIREAFETIHLPVIVKPINGGSSFGTHLVRTYPELEKALLDASKYSENIMIEDFINGIEATCGVIDAFRGDDLYALPPIEIRPHTEFFDYESKYSGKSNEIIPATFDHATKLEIERLAKEIHKALDLKHYSRSDFIIHPKKGIYALEVNTLPGLTKESLIPKALHAVGSSIGEFVHHVIQRALLNKR